MSKHFFSSLLYISFLAILLLSSTNLKGQETTSTPSKDTINLKEVTIERDKQTKITGTLTGKITLHVEGIKNLPALMGNTDVLKMLELTPGVQTSGDGNSNLYIRGGDPGQNLLLYNGNTIYTPGHIINFFPLFNVDHLSTLELMKSGVNAQYGGFLSSAIAVESKKKLPQRTSIKGNVGLLSSQATLDLKLNDKFGAYISGRGTYLELLLKPLLRATINSKDGNNLNDMKYDFYDGNVTLIGKFSERNKLTVDLFSSSDKMQIADDDIIIEGFLKWKNTAISAKMETQIGENNSLDQYLLYSNFENRLQTSQSEMYIHLISKMEDIGYRNNLHYSVFNIPLQTGIQYIRHRILPQDTKINNAGMIHKTENQGENISHDMAIQTSSSINITPRLYIEPGLRYNIYSTKIEKSAKTKTFQSIDVRLSTRYKVNEAIYLRGGYSHNNQYINKLTPSSLGLPTDFWVTASQDILPQKGNEVSLGYYQSFNDGMFELSSDIYYRRMNNCTEFDQNFIENDNVAFADKIFYGTGKAYGIEIMLKKNMGKFTGWLSYALGRAERQFDDIDNGQIFPAKYDRRHDISVVGTYTFNQRWDASIVYVYATGNAYTQPSSWYFVNNTPIKEYGKYNSARMPDYNRTDVSVNYWFKKDNGLNFSIHNMFIVNNPIYVFLLVNRNKETNALNLETKRKQLFKIVPSISWKFKF